MVKPTSGSKNAIAPKDYDYPTKSQVSWGSLTCETIKISGIVQTAGK